MGGEFCSAGLGRRHPCGHLRLSFQPLELWDSAFLLFKPGPPTSGGEYVSCVQLFAMPWIIAGQAPLYPWNFPGKNTGVGCHSLLQGIFQTQGSNPHLLCLLHCRKILYH